MSVDYSNIKLIIWDLDETLWSGVLSDDTAHMSNENVQLIKDIVNTGVMCSICSKNDEEQVHAFLKKYDIDDLFVFASINWTPKGERVKQIIKDMALREVNTLFIDDNVSNLAEVKSACVDIITANVDELPEMKLFYHMCEKKDLSHTRLKQYKVLEEKLAFKAKFGSNEEFLFKSNIQVTVNYDCNNHIDRIEDLVMRSNQLNFTKQRDRKEELVKLINDQSVNTGYVKVRDNYGDYGIVGFFAIRNNQCIHFVFSCRTLNMGIEQYVYCILGKPYISIIGEVASSLFTDKPAWINQKKDYNSTNSKMNIMGGKILIKGPCDMKQLFAYINETKEIITEFTFVNDKGIAIDSGNHSSMVLQSLKITNSEKERLISLLPFADERIFHTSMFDGDVGTVVFSLFMEPHSGLYKDKVTKAIIDFGEYTNDLTDEKKWPGFLNRELYDANCSFTINQLKQIKANFEYVGRISPYESFNNIKEIYKNLNGKRLILNCGSETPYMGISHEVNKDKHHFNKILNDLLREWMETVDNVYLIDVNDYITGQEDFTNSITHFKKRVYYEMCGRLVEIMRDTHSDNTLSRGSKSFVEIKRLVERVIRRITQV